MFMIKLEWLLKKTKSNCISIISIRLGYMILYTVVDKL